MNRAQLDFVSTEFKHSFRSGEIVLGAVDKVFFPPHAHAGLTADPVPPIHEALPEAAPGLVEIWDLATSDERNDDRALGRAVRHPERQQRDGEARQAHRRIGRGMAASGPASPRTCSFWCGGAARCSKASFAR